MALSKSLTPPTMYYQLRSTPVLEGLYDVRDPDLEVRWLSGQPLSTPLPNPIEIELDDRFGTRMADIFERGILVMSDRLVAALQRAGVTNLQTFPAVLNDAKRGLRLPGFQAVQIVGRIKAADPKKSIAYDPDSVGRTIVAFDKLVIDPKAARGALLFRLLESASTIIVHERVKQELDKESWQFVSVHPTDEKPFPLDLENWAADFQEVLQAGSAARAQKKPAKKKRAASKLKAPAKSKRATTRPQASSAPKGRARKQVARTTRRPRGKR